MMLIAQMTYNLRFANLHILSTVIPKYLYSSAVAITTITRSTHIFITIIITIVATIILVFCVQDENV